MEKAGGRGWFNWTALLFGGLGVAVFTFAAPIVWKALTHRSVGPDYVNAVLRVENGTVLLLVRNNSDEPLDLVQANIEIKTLKSQNSAPEFGAYPTPSHLYEVEAKSTVKLTQEKGLLRLTVPIAQAIEARQVDQFGFRIKSLTPRVGSMTGEVVDSKGNVYKVKY